MNKPLTIALPKGRMGIQSFTWLEADAALPFDDRQLRALNAASTIEYLWVKPVDVLKYVEEGVADLGIVGEDIVEEHTNDVYRLKRLPFGHCRMVIAGQTQSPCSTKDGLRVATKYPVISERYFKSRHQKITLIPLQGSVELAPLVGLADVIVDLVETGATLKANQLFVQQELMTSQAILIANKAKYRWSYDTIQTLLKELEERHALV
jgi:ATP phosphoribosyltransferase